MKTHMFNNVLPLPYCRCSGQKYLPSYRQLHCSTVSKCNMNHASQHIDISQDLQNGEVDLDRTGVIHYNNVIMSAMASQITRLTIAYSKVYSGADQRKHQSSASLAFVRGIHRWPVNSPHKWPVTRKMFPFDDVIMIWTVGQRSADNILVPAWPIHEHYKHGTLSRFNKSILAAGH